jgi:hypothetical protein
MFDSMVPAVGPVVKRVAVFVAAAAIAGAGIGYAVHERHAAQTVAAQNAQMTAQLNAEKSQLEALAAKVNAPAPEAETTTPVASAAPAITATTIGKPSPAFSSRLGATGRSPMNHAASSRDQRFEKLQSQIDAQGQRIEAHDKAIEGTRSDLASARTELSGSIALTHDELVALEKKGERNYYEFDLGKSKQFNRAGPVSISLRKANTKRQYADLVLLVNDRDMSQKHVNLYQPAMFYQSDTLQPVEIVINDISKDHIHGYVSAPKYRKSELAAASNAGAGSASGSQQASSSAGDNGIVGQSTADQAANSTATRKRLPLPNESDQQ